MTEDQKAGSKLLAEFEGYEVESSGYLKYERRTVERDYSSPMTYHTDYNELHRVYRKFRELQGFSPIEKEIHKSLCDNAAVHLTYGNTPELMFLSLIDGVKWYNSLKPKEEK